MVRFQGAVMKGRERYQRNSAAPGRLSVSIDLKKVILFVLKRRKGVGAVGLITLKFALVAVGAPNTTMVGEITLNTTVTSEVP